MKKLIFTVALSLSLLSTSVVKAQTLYTWTGASALLDLESNWSPAGGPPSAFGPDSAVFDASGTTKTGLTPNGTGFSVLNMTFTGATYSFASKGGGDGIGIDGALLLSGGASVNFSDQEITVGAPMSWTLSGNSSFTGGSVNASNLALNIAFGASQLNIASFGSLDLGASGTLVVNNWGGTAGIYSGANNQLRFTVDPTVLLPKISFTGYTGPAATQLVGSYYEVIPVPEPSTYALLGLALAGCIAFRRRRRAA